MGQRQWNSVNNIGVYTDSTKPRRFQRRKKGEAPVENGVILTNGDADHEGEEDIPHVEAPIDNEEEPVNGEGAPTDNADKPIVEDVAVEENSEAPAVDEEAAATEEVLEAAEETPDGEPAVEENADAVPEPEPTEDGVENAEGEVAEEVIAEATEEAPVPEPAPEEGEEAVVEAGEVEPAPEEPAEDEPATEEEAVDEPVAEEAPAESEPLPEEEPVPEDLEPVPEEPASVPEEETAPNVEDETNAPVEEVPVEELETVAEEEEPQPAEEVPPPAEEVPPPADEATPEVEEPEVVPEAGAELEAVPDELQTAAGMAVATDGRLIEKISDNLARTYIRGRPVVMRIPPDLRETWKPEDPLVKPGLEFQLEWVYGYRGQLDGHGNPNFYYLPTGEIVYYVAAVAVLYNLESHTQRHYTGHTNDIHCITVHPSGPYIATGQAEGHSKISSTIQQSHVQVNQGFLELQSRYDVTLRVL